MANNKPGTIALKPKDDVKVWGTGKAKYLKKDKLYIMHSRVADALLDKGVVTKVEPKSK